MTPLEAAVKAADELGLNGPYENCMMAAFNADDARAIITAFLEAAAEDGETCWRVATVAAERFDLGSGRAAGGAAILALKEAVNG